MRSIAFRLLAGLLGFGIVVALLAIAEIRQPSDGFWPNWVYVLSFLITAAVFLIYAITGRAWPRAYGQKILRKNDDFRDR